VTEPPPTLSPETRQRALALLREAIAASDRLQGMNRSWARYRIATYLRSLGLAEELAHYGQDEIDAANALHKPEWHQARKELQEIEADAARKLLARDFAGARETYQSGEEQRATVLGNLDRFGDFFGWLLEMGGIDLALEFYRSDDWKTAYRPEWAIYDVIRLAKALAAAGRQPEGTALRREGLASLDEKTRAEDLALIGKTLWRNGERDEGRDIVRRAAQASLDAALQNEDLYWDTTISLADDLCAMSDFETAASVLRPIMAVVPPPLAPLSEEELRQQYETLIAALRHSGDLPREGETERTFKVVSLPAARARDRWEKAVPVLAKVLTRAGLDDEASSLLASLPDQRIDILSAIIEGKAFRRRFAEAFETLESLQAAAVGLENHRVLAIATWFVLRHAAKAGDVAAYRRASSMHRQFAPAMAAPHRPDEELKELAHAGQVEAALEAARAVEEQWLPEALLSVVEGLTNISRRVPNARAIQDEFHFW